MGTHDVGRAPRVHVQDRGAAGRRDSGGSSAGDRRSGRTTSEGRRSGGAGPRTAKAPRRSSTSIASDAFVLGAELPIVLSVPKAARLLGISKDLAYQLVSQGDLPAIYLGRRRVVVPTRRLLEFLDAEAGATRSSGARSL